MCLLCDDMHSHSLKMLLYFSRVSYHVPVIKWSPKLQYYDSHIWVLLICTTAAFDKGDWTSACRQKVTELIATFTNCVPDLNKYLTTVPENLKTDSKLMSSFNEAKVNNAVLYQWLVRHCLIKRKVIAFHAMSQLYKCQQASKQT